MRKKKHNFLLQALKENSETGTFFKKTDC